MMNIVFKMSKRIWSYLGRNYNVWCLTKLWWQSSVPCIVYDSLTSSEFFLLQVQQEKKACVPCLVGSRISELTAHYIYDLVTGLVGSYRHYLSRRSLCQTEKVCESIYFLNVILIFSLWYLTGLISWLLHLFCSMHLLFYHFIFLAVKVLS